MYKVKFKYANDKTKNMKNSGVNRTAGKKLRGVLYSLI